LKSGLFSSKAVFYIISIMSVVLLAWRPMHVNADTASMSLTLSSQSATQGSTFSVTVHENSGTDTVNGVQVSLTYPTDKLSYSSISYAGNAFNVHASESSGGGSVKLSVGKTPPPVSGDQVVAIVNFQAVASGTANIAFGCSLSSGSCPDGNAVVRDTDSVDILASTVGASININSTDHLSTGQVLSPGQFIVAPDVLYVLLMQGDGNLVLYGNARPIWASNTSGSGGNRVVLQADGNLVIYRANNTPVWASNTAGIGAGASLYLQDDGNTVIYNSSMIPKWASNTGGHQFPSASGSDRLTASQTLPTGKYIKAQDGRSAALLQVDGNLVVYGAGYRVLWSSGTSGRSVSLAAMQGDGNLVLYTAAISPIWASNTSGNGASFAVIQTDGNFVIYTNGGIPKWNTGTAGKIL
jgi:hypothetical protein